MKKYFLNISVLLLLSFQALGQGEVNNHKKYWYYKTRLNNDFIKVGLLPGESIPFNERGNAGSVFYPVIGNTLKAGDASARLGIYLAVLATEYKLLKNSGQDLTLIKHEIFCALNAINRIDYVAEPAFNPNMNPDLNGFFVRDDIPFGFLNYNHEHFNYYNNGTPSIKADDKGFTQMYTQGVTNLASTYSSISVNWPAVVTQQDYEDKILSGSEESQDQAYYLLMGLTLTSKLVDGADTDGGNVFGYGSSQPLLAVEAKNIATRILNHIKSDPFWRIRNPAHLFSPNSFVHAGHNASTYAYPMDNLGDFIVHNDQLPFIHHPINGGTWPTATMPLTQTGAFRNAWSSSSTAGSSWMALAGLGGGVAPDHMGFFNILAGAANCVYEPTVFIDLTVQNAITALHNQINTWISEMNDEISSIENDFWANVLGTVAELVGNVQFVFNNLISAAQAVISGLSSLLLPTLTANTSENKLLFNSLNSVIYYTGCDNFPMHVHYGSQQYFGIYLREILHGNINLPSWLQWLTNPVPAKNIIRNDVKAVLDSAPCEGNYNYNGSSVYSPNIPTGDLWGASCFLDRPDHLWKKTCLNNTGEFSGLDYLLLHNLYYLTEGVSVPITDYSSRTVSISLPHTLGGVVHMSQANPGTIGAFEYLFANNTINFNGDVTYRAGKEINLDASFQVKAGADFHAYISPFQCSAVGEQLRTTASSNFFEGSTGETHVPDNHSSNSNIKDNILYSYDEQIKTVLNVSQDSVKQRVKMLGELHEKINVYPNPSDGRFSIRCRLDKDDNVHLRIVNVLGEVVYDEKFVVGDVNMPVDLTGYPKGFYILNISYTNGKQESKEIIIQ